MKLNEIVYSLNDTCNSDWVHGYMVEMRAVIVVAVASAGAQHSNAVFSRAPESTDCSLGRTTTGTVRLNRG